MNNGRNPSHEWLGYHFFVLSRSGVRVLLVEDNRTLSRSLRQGLEEEGYAVDVAYDGEEGRFKAEATSYDAIILDLMLPKEDGLSLIRHWRGKGLTTHVLVLTARGTLDDKVKGLDLGADDYLTKPFELEELLARLRALVRRGQRENVGLKARFEIDTAAHTAAGGTGGASHPA